VAKQVIHRRYLFTIAGNDQVKVTKIRVHVERETMCGSPASDVHADGRDLSARSMHAGKALESKGANLKVCQRSNQHFFKVAARSDAHPRVPD